MTLEATNKQPNAYREKKMSDNRTGKSSLTNKNLIKGLAGDLSTQEMLHLFIDMLPEKERKVLKLHYWEGLNFGRIAKKLNLRPSGVAISHKKALKRLRHKKRLLLSNYNYKGKKC